MAAGFLAAIPVFTANLHKAMPPILDVAIGTIFIFLLFSIVVTALNEVVLTFFDKRADFLRLGLGDLLNDSQEGKVKGYRTKVREFLTAKFQHYGALIVGIPAVAIGPAIGAKIGSWLKIPSLGWIIYLTVAAVIAVVFWLFAKRVFPQPAARKSAPKPPAPKAGKTEINVQQIFDHPLIFSHSRGDSDPSYIASTAFVKAMLDLLVPAGTVSNDSKQKLNSAKLAIEDLEKAIPKVSDAKLQKSLAALLRSAEGDVDKFKTALEDWFNHSMDRVTGWYKLHAQTWLLVLSFVLAVVCNVDALRIIQTLSKNPNLANAVAAQAEAYAKTNNALLSKEELDEKQAQKEKKTKEAREKLEKLIKDKAEALAKAQAALDQAEGDAAKTKTAQADLDKVNLEYAPKLTSALDEVEQSVNLDGALADFKKDLNELSSTGIPMGWDGSMRKEFGFFKNPEIEDWSNFDNLQDPRKWYWSVLITALCGWGVTALAASLGAPFWFDMLQRVMNLRANGRKPEEKDLNTKKADEKKTDGTTKP